MAAFQWWEPKRLRTLAERGLDFQDAEALLAQANLYTYPSPRGEEDRWVSIGYLDERLVAVVWTQRDNTTRIITMRRARREERRRFGELYG